MRPTYSNNEYDLSSQESSVIGRFVVAQGLRDGHRRVTFVVKARTRHDASRVAIQYGGCTIWDPRNGPKRIESLKRAVGDYWAFWPQNLLRDTVEPNRSIAPPAEGNQGLSIQVSLDQARADDLFRYGFAGHELVSWIFGYFSCRRELRGLVVLEISFEDEYADCLDICYWNSNV